MCPPNRFLVGRSSGKGTSAEMFLIIHDPLSVGFVAVWAICNVIVGEESNNRETGEGPVVPATPGKNSSYLS